MENLKQSPPPGKKVLVIDDDADIVEVVKIILENNGFEVCTYNSGLKVSQIVLTNLPNLVLLDIGLPGKSGTEVCKELKEAFAIPVIYFSAQSDKDKAYKVCEADEYIHKPFEVKELLSKLGLFLN